MIRRVDQTLFGHRATDILIDRVIFFSTVSISGPDVDLRSRSRFLLVPLWPVPFFDPFIQHLARRSELFFIATPSFGPLIVDLLLCFQEARRLLDAGVSSRIQNCWLELKTQSVQNSP